MIVASKAAHSFLIAWALALLSSATAGGTASDPNMTSEEFFATMAAQADTPDISYDLIKRRLLEGRYDDARAALDRRDTSSDYVFSGYRFALLRARCARAVFLFGSHRIRPEGQSDAERGVLLRQVALQTTIAYEEAFRLASSDFERACVYARWHELHTRSNFEADSLLLRSGNPLEHLDRPVDETLSKQAARLRAVASKALDSIDLNSLNLTVDRQAFLAVLTSEYEKLGRMGVPAAVFDEILEDVPQFLQEAIDSFVLVQPEKFRVTIQYYLWYALTGPRPDRIDNEFIERQIRTVDQYLRYALTSAGSGYEEAVSQRFLGQVAIERNNRFILHFKEPLWPQEWSEQRPGSTAKNIQQAIIDRINSEVSQFGQGPIQHLLSRFLTQEQLRKELDEQIARSVRSLAGSAIFELTRYQNLLRHQHPPGARFTGGGGTGHRTSGIEVWRSDKSEPTPPYPWKKNLTRLDSAVASTRKIAQRMLTAVASTDTATLDALSLDSKGFSREDLHRLIQTLSDHRVEIEPERARDTNDIVVVQPYTWTALRVASETDEALALVFCRKEGGYWLAWAGLTEGISVQPLAILLEQLKPELESRPINEQRDIAPPAAIASLDDVRDINTVDPIEAGHAWRVRLAFGEYAPLPSAQALYCQAEWIDPNRPAKAVPFGRFAGKHVGPVLWTLAADGFREGPLGFNSQAAPRMTLRGDGCLYAAILPPSSTSQVYVQVYSAFDGRELARRRIEPTAAVPWGHFMAHKSGELYGVATTFEAACPALPAFKPLPSSTPETITLSLEGDVFAIKSGSRILPARGCWPAGGSTTSRCPRSPRPIQVLSSILMPAMWERSSESRLRCRLRI